MIDVSNTLLIVLFCKICNWVADLRQGKSKGVQIHASHHIGYSVEPDALSETTSVVDIEFSDIVEFICDPEGVEIFDYPSGVAKQIQLNFFFFCCGKSVMTSWCQGHALWHFPFRVRKCAINSKKLAYTVGLVFLITRQLSSFWIRGIILSLGLKGQLDNDMSI